MNRSEAKEIESTLHQSRVPVWQYRKHISALLAHIEAQDKLIEQMAEALYTNTHEDNDFNCPDSLMGPCSACEGAEKREQAHWVYRQWREEQADADA